MFSYCFIGMLTLSPMTVVPVCRVSDAVTIRCRGLAVQFMSWSIQRQETYERVINDQVINSRDAIQMPAVETVNSTTFTFVRSSAHKASPLISTLSIDSVSIGLNGTVVNCKDVQNPTISASTTIHIIDTRQGDFLL